MARTSLDHVQRNFYDKFLVRTAKNGADDRYWTLYQYHAKRITNLCLNRFKWLNMPKTVDIRFLEMQLFRSALAVFYYDFDLERFFAAQGTPTAARDMFDNPTAYRIVGNKYVVRRPLPVGMCVPIHANYLRIPDHDLVMLWAGRIADLELSLEINTKNARRTRTLVTDENTRLSGNAVIEAIDRGDPTVEVTADIAASGMVNAFDLGINPDTLTELHVLRIRLENQMMSELGIDNANQDKKERLVAAEVDANDDPVSVAKSVHLNARKFAALQINDIYGLDIEVDYGSDVVAEAASRTTPGMPETGVPQNWPGEAKPKEEAA